VYFTFLCRVVIMVCLLYRADHYIFALWFFPFSFFFSSPNLSRRRLDVHFHQFRIQVWNVLHAARWKCKTQKSPSAHHSTTLSDYIFVTKALIGNQKNLLNSDTSPTCPYNMMNFDFHQRLKSVGEFGASQLISMGFYSAPQCSHCKRCISYGNSVRPSVCLSVRHTPVLCQNDGT